MSLERQIGSAGQRSSEVLTIGNSGPSIVLFEKFRFSECRRRFEKVRYRLTERRTHENEIFKIRISTREGIGDRSGMMGGCISECFAVLRRVWMGLERTS